MNIPYEQVLDMADHLPVEKQLQLIADLSTRVQKELASSKGTSLSTQPKRSFADMHGIWRGAVFNEEDFKAAEWHPTEEELNSAYAASS